MSKTDPQTALWGRSLEWLSCDERGVFTAALRRMLEDRLHACGVAVHLQRLENFEQMRRIGLQQGWGLVSSAIDRHDQLLPACMSIQRLRHRWQRAVQLCWIASGLEDTVPILLESGAQIVVGQLPSLDRGMPRIISALPLQASGVHPLTTGLVERLPWPSAES